MLITPLLSNSLGPHAQAGEEELKRESAGGSEPPSCSARKDNVISVNGADVGFDELVDRLKRMFAAREDHVLFFDAADDAEYGFAVQVLDRAREGGAVTIATLAQALSPGAATQP